MPYVIASICISCVSLLTVLFFSLMLGGGLFWYVIGFVAVSATVFLCIYKVNVQKAEKQPHSSQKIRQPMRSLDGIGCGGDF